MSYINYAKSYTGAARQFTDSYASVGGIQGIKHFLGGYQKVYEGAFDKQYEGVFTKQYESVFGGTFVGVYDKVYLGNYTKHYEGSFETTYEGVYSTSYTKTYLGIYERQFSQQFEGAFNTNYNKNYEGVFEGTFSGGPYETQYAKVWTGTYENATDVFAAIYSRQFEGVYEGYYDRDYNKIYEGTYSKQFTKTYVGVYAKTWTGQYSRQFLGTFNSYRKELLYFTNNFVRDYTTNYTRDYVGYFGRDYLRNYDRQYAINYSKTYAGNFVQQYTGNFTRDYTQAYEGVYQRGWVSQYHSISYQLESFTDNEGEEFEESVEYYDTFQSNYLATYTGQYGASVYTGSYVSGGQIYFGDSGNSGGFTKAYVGPGNYTPSYHGDLGFFNALYIRYFGGYVRTFAPPSYLANHPVSWKKTFLRIYSGTFYTRALDSRGDEGNESFVAQYGDTAYNANWVRASQQTWSQQFGSNYTHLFQKNYQKNYTRNYTKNYTKNYAKNYQKQYLKTYQKAYQKIFELTEYYIGQWEGLRTHTFEGVFHAQYEGSYDRQWTGYFTGQYTKTYTKTYVGQWLGQYTGDFHKTWTKSYEGSFNAQYTGLQRYNGNTTGNFVGQYTGIYTKNYMKTYLGQYEGQFTGAFEGAFDHNYIKHYTGQYTKVYLGLYSHEYIGAYTKAYEGAFGSTFLKAYEKSYIGQFTGTYLGLYTKTYGGAYQGVIAQAPRTRYYINNYASLVQYNQTYSTTTSVANTTTGELTDDGGLLRVKEDSEWKQVRDIRVKEDDQWKEVAVARVKENGEWKVVEVNYQRSDITISSNTANYNLFSALTSAGKTPGSRPQHVNLTIDGAYVYSANTTAALSLDGFSAINSGSDSLNHKVKILVKGDGYIVGKSGDAGTGGSTGTNGSNGGDAILLGNGVELYVENYGLIAGGGGGGGGGGYPVAGGTGNGGTGGIGAGWKNTAFVSESSSSLNGSDAPNAFGIHGGNGGLLGQFGDGASGYNDDADASQNVARNAVPYSEYAQSGDGGLPGSAIKGYDASRVSLINTGNVFGDSAFKFKA